MCAVGIRKVSSSFHRLGTSQSCIKKEIYLHVRRLTFSRVMILYWVMYGVYYGLLPQILCPPSLLLQTEIQGSLLRAAQAFQSHLWMAQSKVFD